MNNESIPREKYRILLNLLFIFGICFFFPFLVFSQTDAANIDSPQKKWVGISSGITLTGQYYKTSLNSPRQQPFMYSISGSPVIDIKGFSMPFSVIYSNQVFSYQQPFNPFGIAPTFNFGTFYLGSSSIRFSNYTLSGVRFLGAGADLQIKKLRIGGMYGRLRRAVLPIGNDDDQYSYIKHSETESFQRLGYAVKLGFGTRQEFFDLIYFKAYDVLPKKYNSSDWEVTPIENVVIGINSSFKINTVR